MTFEDQTYYVFHMNEPGPIHALCTTTMAPYK